MCDCFATFSGEGADSSVEEQENISWIQVEFGGRIYLVPRS
jgi:hypothetical protein